MAKKMRDGRKMRENTTEVLTVLGTILDEDRRARLQTMEEYAKAMGIHARTLSRLRTEDPLSFHSSVLTRVAVGLGYPDRAALGARMAELEAAR